MILIYQHDNKILVVIQFPTLWANDTWLNSSNQLIGHLVENFDLASQNNLYSENILEMNVYEDMQCELNQVGVLFTLIWITVVKYTWSRVHAK